MTEHEEFSTEDFLFYAAECHRLAELARPPENGATNYPKWANRAGHAPGNRRERRRYLRLAKQTVY
jgi:hypothetical protein